jgi:glycerophosphoryl diester phosphodiesterase
MKTAQVNISTPISDEEIYQAKKALIIFKYTSKVLFAASDYLNLMKTPFKDNQEINTDEVWNARVSLRIFRDKAVENFNQFKLMAFKCVNSIYSFSSDTTISQLSKSLISTIDQLEKTVNKFVDLFDDLKSKDFNKKIVEIIEKIQDRCEDIDDILSERLKDFIQENILASNWLDEVGMKNNLTLNKKIPLLEELNEKFNSDKEELNKNFNRELKELK